MKLFWPRTLYLIPSAMDFGERAWPWDVSQDMRGSPRGSSMFTGLVEGTGRVTEMVRIGEDMSLTIQPLFPVPGIRVGESINVNGACLTVTRAKGKSFTVDVSAESLSRTTMGRLKVGDEVNLERALHPTDRLGGHLVSGHVDGVGKVLRREQKQRSWLFEIGIDESVSRYIIEKGSIAVDGISLTVNRCSAAEFEVNIIPQTGKETTILKKKAGDLVNIETDMIGKYVEKFLKREKGPGEKERPSSIDEDMLRKYGFGD
jgi:riboflavin synthase